ncbi:MAG: hypothetical protein COA77_06620 [Thaumarchaeota archaeon]|nr:MAG: hypothetical protein COA77_06620 [Nitrososphaerota archaeon]
MHYQCPECDKEGKTESELRKNGCNCKIQPLQMHDSKDHDGIKQKKSYEKNLDDDKRSDQKKLYDFALTRIDKLVISENNSDEVFGILKNNNHIETFNLSSTRAIHWLTNEHNLFGNSNELHSSDYYKTILNTIISKATMNGTKKVKVYNRIAQLEDEIWYDLGNSSWQSIKITKSKVKLVKLDKDSPVFRRSQSLQEQILPKRGSNFSLDQLVNLLHISEQDQLVFKINLICLFLQAYSMPMIVFDGSAGSIKTTATATVKRIVDPAGKLNQDNVSSMQEKPNDLVIQLSNRYLASFDNVSYIDSKISDVTCRAITGSNNERRKLYTDNDEAIFSFRSKIVLNGIIPTLDYPDLQTRLISYDRETIDETNLITEKEFQKRLDGILPSVLGIIFKTLAKALQKYPELKDTIKPKTRMADFEIWGEIISRCLGNVSNKFLKEYYVKVNQRNLSNQENYPIIQTIQILMKNKKFHEDSALNVYAELSKIAEEKLILNIKDRFVKFPKHYNQITKQLISVKPLLKTAGFDVINYHWTKHDPKFDKNTSIIRISKIESQKTLGEVLPKKSSLPSLSSPSEKQAQKTEKTSESSEGSHKPNSEPSLKSSDSGHKKQASESSEDSESNLKKFYCHTCDAGEWGENESTELNGNIVEFHRKLDHDIQLWEKK